MKVLLVDDEDLQLLRLEESVKNVLLKGEILSFNNPNYRSGAGALFFPYRQDEGCKAGSRAYQRMRA